MRPQFEKWNDKLSSLQQWSKRVWKAEIFLYQNVIYRECKNWTVIRSQIQKFSPHGSCYLFHCSVYSLSIFLTRLRCLCTHIFRNRVLDGETTRNRDEIKPITGWCFWPLAVCVPIVITLQTFSVGQNDLFDVL